MGDERARQHHTGQPDRGRQGIADGGGDAARAPYTERFGGPVRGGSAAGPARNGQFHAFHPGSAGADHPDGGEELPRLYGRGPQGHWRVVDGGDAERRDRAIPPGVVPLRSGLQRRIWRDGTDGRGGGRRNAVSVEGSAGQSCGDEEMAASSLPGLRATGDRHARAGAAASEALPLERGKTAPAGG